MSGCGEAQRHASEPARPPRPAPDAGAHAKAGADTETDTGTGRAAAAAATNGPEAGPEAGPGAGPGPDAEPALAPIHRPREREFVRERARFDPVAYLAQNPDVRAEIGFDPEGAWRHWSSVGPAQNRAAPGLARAAPRRVDPARAMARPFGIALYGPFEAISGLGTAARNLRDAVAAAGIPHAVHTLDAETGHLRIARAAPPDRPRFRVNLVLANADQIRHVAGLYPDGEWDDAYTIAVWAWELAAFRPDWRASFALVDEVWTNSRFELDAIAACAPVPVHLVPLPVPPPPDDPDGRTRREGRARFGIPADAFAFLCPFDAGSTAERKNPFAAIAAFRAAFGTEASTRLVVKCHGADAGLRGRLAEACAGAANILVIDRRLDAAAMRALQAACDAVVSSHRSEGFGLNLAEFAASGGVVVATDYSGSVDFLEREHDRPVAARLVELDRRAGPYLAHAVWAEPDADALVRRLREARRARRRGARDPARAERFASSFGVAAIAARIAARLDALDLRRAMPPWTGATAREPGPPPQAGSGHAPQLGPEHAPQAGPDPAPEAGSALAPEAAPAAPGATSDHPPGANPIAWPARLPTFGVVVLEENRDDRDALLDALERQHWPFAEILLVGAAPPPPEDFAARAALRRGSDAVRLVAPGTADPLLRAAEAASGAWLVVPDAHALPDPDALLQAALALDRDDPPDRLRLAVPGGGLAILRKSAVLAGAPPPAAEAANPALDALLARPREVASLDMDGLGVADLLPLAEGGGASLAALAAAIPPGRLRGLLVDAGGGVPLLVTARDAARPSAPPAAPIERRDPRAMPAAPPLEAHVAAIRASGLLDARHYAVSAPDVAAAGIDPVAHYCEYGWREHRAPSFYFDPVFYRARYMAADPEEALDPLLHWLAHRWSGVRPSPLFDPAWVRRRLSLPPGTDPLAAYLARRNTEDVGPLAEFDPAYYRARRRDVAYLGVDPFEHYMRFGVREGLDPSAEFDTRFYAARHMRDVVGHDPVAANPLLHFLERRDAHPVVTSRRAALRQQVARLRMLGRHAIDLAFCWHDGLPQQVEFLRAFLAEPSLAMPFRVVLANEAVAQATADPRLLAALRLPYADPFDDRDIVDRLAECMADPRCLRVDGAPVLGVIGGAMPEAARGFAERLADLMRRTHSVTPMIERVDREAPGPP